MSTIAISSILSLLSALIVAILGYVFSTGRKQRDELAEMRLKAYTDFINSVSRLVAARRTGRTTDESAELTELNDAKTRICICADAYVVEALVEFWRYGGKLEKEQEILAFTRLCKRIRISLGNQRHDISQLEISNTLFKLEPSTYSYPVERASRSIESNFA